LLRFNGCLHEHLGVDIVVILRNKLSKLSQKLHDVDSLLQLLGRQMGSDNVNSKLFFRKNSHVLI